MRGEIQKTSIISRTKPPFAIQQKKRPSSPLNIWIKERKGSYQITRKDVCYIYRNIIFTKSVGELREIMDNDEKRDKMPALVITIIASVLGDIARGNMLNLVRMLNFVFPNSMKDFDPDRLADQGGYDELQELENAIRRLEGDDGLMIVDKLLMAEGEYAIIDNAG